MRKSSRRMAFIVAGPLVMMLALALSACEIPDPFVASYHTSSSSSTAVPWPTFTDPTLGFSISYPPSWTSATGYDGAITLFGPSHSWLTPVVTTVSQSPNEALAQATPSAVEQSQQQLTVTQTQVAGNPAIDIFYPHMSPALQGSDTVRPLASSRSIIMAVTNDAGTTNVYTFLAVFVADTNGNMSAAAVADNQTISAILTTFQLPPKIGPVATHP